LDAQEPAPCHLIHLILNVRVPASPTLVHLAAIPAKEEQVTVARLARWSILTLRASPLSALSPMLSISVGPWKRRCGKSKHSFASMGGTGALLPI
jgi:hypothetical protein